jgi:hypothetical protein
MSDYPFGKSNKTVYNNNENNNKEQTQEQKFLNAIDKISFEEVNSLTENYEFSENILNIGLVRSINNFKSSNEALEIIKNLIR